MATTRFVSVRKSNVRGSEHEILEIAILLISFNQHCTFTFIFYNTFTFIFYNTFTFIFYNILIYF